MQLLLFVLELIQPIVDPALDEELLMRTLLAQPALVEYEDAIRMLNCAETMRDHERGSTGEQAVQRFANEQLCFGIHAGSGFVENQEARIMRQRAGKIDELPLADGKCRTALVNTGSDSFWKRADEISEANFIDSPFDGAAVNVWSAEANVCFDCTGEKERILEHDAELPAQILQIDGSNVLAVEKNLAALNIVKAQEQGNQGGLAGAGMSDDGEGLPGLDAEGYIAQNPIFVGGLRSVAIAEPDVAKFDLTERMIERDGVGIRFNQHGFIQKLEDALGSRHRGLQDVEFLAEILDRPEKTLRKHREGGQNAEAERTRENTVSAGPIDQGDGGEAEKLDRRIEESVSENRIAPGEHIVAIAPLKFLHGFAFTVEELHDAHAGNIFLKESVDAGNGGADAAIGVADELAEDHGDDQDAREDGESIERQAAVDGEEQAGHDREKEEIVDHGNNASGEEIVEGIHVRGDTRDQAADGITVEIAHRQALHVGENFAAHVVHGLLANALHDANLDILGEEVERQYGQKKKAKPADTGPCRVLR